MDNEIIIWLQKTALCNYTAAKLGAPAGHSSVILDGLPMDLYFFHIMVLVICSSYCCTCCFGFPFGMAMFANLDFLVDWLFFDFSILYPWPSLWIHSFWIWPWFAHWEQEFGSLFVHGLPWMVIYSTYYVPHIKLTIFLKDNFVRIPLNGNFLVFIDVQRFSSILLKSSLLVWPWIVIHAGNKDNIFSLYGDDVFHILCSTCWIVFMVFSCPS